MVFLVNGWHRPPTAYAVAGGASYPCQLRTAERRFSARAPLASPTAPRASASPAKGEAASSPVAGLAVGAFALTGLLATGAAFTATWAAWTGVA